MGEETSQPRLPLYLMRIGSLAAEAKVVNKQRTTAIMNLFMINPFSLDGIIIPLYTINRNQFHEKLHLVVGIRKGCVFLFDTEISVGKVQEIPNQPTDKHKRNNILN